MNTHFLPKLLFRRRGLLRRGTETPVVVDDRVSALPSLPQPVLHGTVGQQEEYLGRGLVVKRFFARQKVVINALRASIEPKLSHLFFELPLEFMESFANFVGALFRKLEVDRQLVKPVLVEARFDGMGGLPRFSGDASSLLLKRENLNIGLVRRQLHENVQLHLARPLQQARRSFAPLTPKGRLEQNRGASLSGLSGKTSHREDQGEDSKGEQKPHGRRIALFRKSRKTARCRGSMLVELSLAVALLLFVSLWVFRTNLQTIRPRNWAMTQAVSDAYMTEHQARAEAIDFNDLLSAASPWPAFPTSNTTNVTIGTLPNGRVLTGQLVQTRQPSENNLATAGGLGDVTTNPARVESWIVQSHLTYDVGGRSYVKSRTTVRTR